MPCFLWVASAAETVIFPKMRARDEGAPAKEETQEESNDFAVREVPVVGEDLQ